MPIETDYERWYQTAECRAHRRAAQAQLVARRAKALHFDHDEHRDAIRVTVPL
jgi:hypothetical protein